MTPTRGKPVVLCGYGRLGRGIFALLAKLGRSVHVICRELPADWPEPAPDDSRLIIGDARSESRLREAGIETAATLIAATHDDPTNIAIALSAKRLNPGLSVVVRLFDQDLGGELEKTLGLERTFSTSALAAPAFVAAALGRTGRLRVDCPGTSARLEEIDPFEDGAPPGISAAQWSLRTGRVLFGVGRAGEWIFAPEPSRMISDGDRILTLAYGSSGAPPADGRRADRISGIRLPLQGLREWWREAPGALRVTFAALLLVAAGSIGVFHYSLGMPWVDALYFVFTIITTTGFGDFNLMSAPAVLKLYGVFLMLCGAAILAAIFSIITDIALNTRLKEVFARGCSRYTGHIIVAGLGNVGFRVLKALRENGERAVAVEQDENGKFVRTARALAPVVLGNARMEETLRKAGAAGAKAVIAVTDNDISNLSIGLAAKRLRPECRTVLRIFDADLAERMDGKPVADCALSVARIAAASFAASVLDANAVAGFELEGGLAAFAEPTGGGAGGPDDRVRSAGTAAIALPAAGGPTAGRPVILRWHEFKSAGDGTSLRNLTELPPEKAAPC